MGTFVILPISITGVDVTHWSHIGAGTEILAVQIRDDGKNIRWSYGGAGLPVDATIRCGFGLSDALIYLDGSPTPLVNGYNGLPPGFQPLTASVVWYGNLVSMPADGSKFYVQGEDSVFEETEAVNGGGVGSVTIYNHIGAVANDMLLILTHGAGVRAHASNTQGTTVDQLEIIGTYSIIASASWYTDGTDYQYANTDPGVDWTPTTSPFSYNANTGETILTSEVTAPTNEWELWIPNYETGPIAINSAYFTPNLIIPVLVKAKPIPFPLPLKTTDIEFDLVNFEPIIFNPIRFDIPEFEEDDEFPDYFLYIEQDNGYSISVGGAATVVFIASPSGIYTLVKNKTNDTLYDRTGSLSVDVKIPNPFIETAFFGK